jgi:hypothetical protein
MTVARGAGDGTGNVIDTAAAGGLEKTWPLKGTTNVNSGGGEKVSSLGRVIKKSASPAITDRWSRREKLNERAGWALKWDGVKKIQMGRGLKATPACES